MPQLSLMETLAQAYLEHTRAWSQVIGRLAEVDPMRALEAAASGVTSGLLVEALRAVASGTTSAAADTLGVPQNLRLAEAHVLSPTRALITLAWEPVQGADEYWVYHEFGSPYTPDMRLVAKVAQTTITFGTTPPFVVTPGAPWTGAVYAAAGGVRAPVPAVLEVQVPPYVAPPQSRPFPTPLEVIQASTGVEQAANAIVFQRTVRSSAGKTVTLTCQFDTGAYTDVLALTAADAQALGFTVTGTVQVSGVGGTVQLQETDVEVEIGGTWRTVKNAVIDPSLQVSLWGAALEIDDHLAVAWNPDTARIAFYVAKDFPL